MAGDAPDLNLEMIGNGDPAEWRRLFYAHDHTIRTVIAWRKWNFPPDVREEVHQAVRTSMPAAMASFKNDAPLSIFIKRVAINRCVDEIRSRAPRRAMFLQLGDAELEEHVGKPNNAETEPDETLSHVIRQELIDAARLALDRLDADSAELIREYYFKDMKYREIALKRGVSPGAVAGKLSGASPCFV
jgi:RNA polymerase sigma factor (sigma-70 family)